MLQIWLIKESVRAAIFYSFVVGRYAPNVANSDQDCAEVSARSSRAGVLLIKFNKRWVSAALHP